MSGTLLPFLVSLLISSITGQPPFGFEGPLLNTTDGDYSDPFSPCPGNTCHGRCGEYRQDCKYFDCNCDRYCPLFKDCCSDFHRECPEQSSAKMDEAFIQRSHVYKNHSSLARITPNIDLKVVSSCPSEFPIIKYTHKEKCEERGSFSRETIEYYVFVTADFHVFLNRYCALCHGLETATPVRLSFRCKSQSMLEAKRVASFHNNTDIFSPVDPVENNFCSRITNPKDLPRFSHRFLFPILYISDCDYPCNDFQSVISFNNGSDPPVFFKNSLCFKCGGYMDYYMYGINHIDCGSNMCWVYKSLSMKPQFYDLSFSIMVDFTRGFQSISQIQPPTGGSSCPFGQIYDIVNDICTVVSCSHGYVMVDGNCVHLYSDEGKMSIINKNPMIMSMVFATPDIHQDDIFRHKMLISLSDLVQLVWFNSGMRLSATFIKEGCKGIPFDKEVYSQMKHEAERLICFIYQYKVFKTEMETIQELFKIKLKIKDKILDGELGGRIWYLSVFNFNHLIRPNCEIGEKYRSKSVILFDWANPDNYRDADDMYQDETKFYVYFATTGYYYRFNEVALQLHESFEIIDSDGSGLIWAINITAPIELYAEMCVVHICNATSNSSEKCSTRDSKIPFEYIGNHTTGIQTHGDSIQGWMTLCGNSISVTSLVITLVSLCIMSYLNIFLRVLLINLSVSLIVAQVTFQCQVFFVDWPRLCRIVAIIQHYMWLVYFFLMNTMAFDICNRFSNMKSLVRHLLAKHSRLNRTRMACFLVYSWTCPILIVMSSVLLDHFGYVEMQYGNSESCWISNPHGLLFFFVIPFSIIIFINIILVCRTMVVIHRVMNDIHRDLSLADRSHFCTYTRLMFLMGLSWIFAFVAVFSQVDFFWYIFIVFNTIQGIYILCSFVVNRKILVQMQTYCCEWRAPSMENNCNASGLSEAGSVVSSIVHVTFPGRKAEVPTTLM